jgi:hypothetical protein
MRAQVEAVKSGAIPAPKRRESRMEKEKRLEEENSASNALERLSMMVAVRVGENVGIQFGETQPSEQVHLTRGSAYGEDGHPVLTEKELPRKGGRVGIKSSRSPGPLISQVGIVFFHFFI